MVVLQTRADIVQDVMSLQSEQERKIFVRGLNHQTTEEGFLRAKLSQEHERFLSVGWQARP